MISRFALTLLIACATTIASAQAVRVMGGTKVPGPLQTYGAPKVVEELGVTAEQKAKIDPLLPESVKSRKMEVRSPEEFEVILKEIETAWEKVKKILDEKQVQRLEEIHRQTMGVRSMLYEANAKKLELTETQKEKINEAYGEAMQEIIAELSPEPDSEGRMRIKMTPEASKRVDKDTLSRLTSVLSQKQLDKWKEMQGKPFEPKKDK